MQTIACAGPASGPPPPAAVAALHALRLLCCGVVAVVSSGSDSGPGGGGSSEVGSGVHAEVLEEVFDVLYQCLSAGHAAAVERAKASAPAAPKEKVRGVVCAWGCSCVCVFLWWVDGVGSSVSLQYGTVLCLCPACVRARVCANTPTDLLG